MIFRKLALLVIGVCGLTVSSAIAQAEDGPNARIRVVIQNIDEVEADLKWLIELSPTPDLKKQWKYLKEEILDAFMDGVDSTRPAGVNLVLKSDGVAKEMRIPLDPKVPVALNAGFLAGLAGMGYDVKEITKGTLFQIEDKSKNKKFFLRIGNKYAWTSPEKAAVPANLPLPAQEYEKLLALQKDVVVELKNTEKDIDKRRSDFKELRKQFEALIKFRRGEEKEAFELRKLSLTQQLNEIERFVVEAEEILATWKLDTKAKDAIGRGEFSMTALPGTDLLKSIEEFAAKPSYFANVTMHPDPVLMGRMTFPLDEIRKQHVKEFYKLVRKPLESEISKRPGKTEPQKAAMKKAMNQFFDMLDAGADLGVLDTFVDCHPIAPAKNVAGSGTAGVAGGGVVLVCGIRAADGKAADAIIKMLPEIKPDWTYKLNVAEHNGVSIHEVAIPKSRIESFQKIFAGQTTCLVGTSKDAVWGGAGADAITQLKAAIDQAAQPAPEKVDPVFLTYNFQVAKLVTLMQIVEKEVPANNADLTREEKQRLKDLERYRKLAEASMKNCNSQMKGELRRDGNKIEGFLELNDCVLKYVGAIIADGVKQIQ